MIAPQDHLNVLKDIFINEMITLGYSLGRLKHVNHNNEIIGLNPIIPTKLQQCTEVFDKKFLTLKWTSIILLTFFDNNTSMC